MNIVALSFNPATVLSISNSSSSLIFIGLFVKWFLTSLWILIKHSEGNNRKMGKRFPANYTTVNGSIFAYSVHFAQLFSKLGNFCQMWTRKQRETFALLFSLCFPYGIKKGYPIWVALNGLYYTRLLRNASILRNIAMSPCNSSTFWRLASENPTRMSWFASDR